MSAISHQGIEVDRCTKCGGLWFDMLEAEDLKQLSGSEAIDTGDAKAAQSRNVVARIQCPKDSSTMIRMVVNGKPHIWYEACTVCYGTYFDAGEFKDFKAESFIDTVKSVFSKRNR